MANLMVKMSDELKAAIEEASGGNMSAFVKETLAARIGYDLTAEYALHGVGRPKTYETPLERQRARNRAERERQQHRKKVLEAVMRQQRLDSIEALEKWLEERGIDISAGESTDDEPARQSA